MKVKNDDNLLIEKGRSMENNPCVLGWVGVKLVKHSFNSSLKSLVSMNLEKGVTTSSNFSTTPAVVEEGRDWNGLQAITGGKI